MKKFFAVLFLSISGIGLNFGQEDQGDNNANLYTFLVNNVSDQFRFPLIGFVNIARGNQNFPQIGYVNRNKNNFTGLQAGFVNMTGGNLTGFQMGFLDIVAGETRGFQLGFINTTAKSLAGIQAGFGNAAVGENVRGLQCGFVNTAANNFTGLQMSLLGVTGRLTGLQLGLFNYADTVENGVPVGLISIVRNGGYKAVELSATETMPVTFSFKTGVRKFYTSLNLSYRPLKGNGHNQLFFGFGIGSIIDINKAFFLNPELVYANGIVNNFQMYLNFVPLAGYNITPRIGILLGPALTWNYGEGDRRLFRRLPEYKINSNNYLLFGGKAALRFQW